MKLNWKLKLAKSTKGTHVYAMSDGEGREFGQVYLPKLVMPAVPPPAMSMTVSDEPDEPAVPAKKRGAK